MDNDNPATSAAAPVDVLPLFDRAALLRHARDVVVDVQARRRAGGLVPLSPEELADLASEVVYRPVERLMPLASPGTSSSAPPLSVPPDERPGGPAWRWAFASGNSRQHINTSPESSVNQPKCSAALDSEATRPRTTDGASGSDLTEPEMHSPTSEASTNLMHDDLSSQGHHRLPPFIVDASSLSSQFNNLLRLGHLDELRRAATAAFPDREVVIAVDRNIVHRVPVDDAPLVRQALQARRLLTPTSAGSGGQTA
jgi:hypothetical protein